MASGSRKGSAVRTDNGSSSKKELSVRFADDVKDEDGPSSVDFRVLLLFCFLHSVPKKSL